MYDVAAGGLQTSRLVALPSATSALPVPQGPSSARGGRGSARCPLRRQPYQCRRGPCPDDPRLSHPPTLFYWAPRREIQVIIVRDSAPLFRCRRHVTARRGSLPSPHPACPCLPACLPCHSLCGDLRPRLSSRSAFREAPPRCRLSSPSLLTPVCLPSGLYRTPTPHSPCCIPAAHAHPSPPRRSVYYSLLCASPAPRLPSLSLPSPLSPPPPPGPPHPPPLPQTKANTLRGRFGSRLVVWWGARRVCVW